MTTSDDLVEDLSIAIAQSRGGQGAGELAEEILRRDHHLFLLIGIVDDGEAAVYYDAGMWNVIKAEIDGVTLDGLRKHRVTREKHWGTVEDWVRDVGQKHWTWLHPRFRWVFGIDFRTAIP